MGKENYLIEGVSGTGKSTVMRELRRLGYHVVDGDNEIAYQGNPETGEKTDTASHENHIWDIEKIYKITSEKNHNATFFCGGSRNWPKFICVFDKVFVLDVDAKTLNQRLDNRDDNDWGKSDEERALINHLHKTKEDVPDGILIDTTKSLKDTVLEILKHTNI